MKNSHLKFNSLNGQPRVRVSHCPPFNLLILLNSVKNSIIKTSPTTVRRLLFCVLIVALLFFPSPAFAYEFAENWTWKDTAYQSAAITLKVIDWGQTRHIAKNPDQWYEMNPMLPRNPSVDQVDAYFAAGIIIETAVALALPPKANVFGYDINPRRIWQMGWIGISGGCVLYNASVGIRIDF